MRVFIRNQINELIPTICEGIQYAKTAEQNEALMIYSDCLDAIRSVKISLESGLSKERYESYNEMVSVVESSIEGLKSGQDDGNKSVEGLIKIADNLTCEEEVKLEVVFFPYKSSMWDSMESVWRAANDDSNCNAYVVPIPYYDKNPDGTFGEYHYEGGDLPKDVPVIHYDIYNLEKHMPDIIYVHNPYDDYNRVTSVDPKFYSSELKKYTNMLVYIPYFATGNMQADTFGNLPFYRNVDYIITQSPKINGFFDKSL